MEMDMSLSQAEKRHAELLMEAERLEIKEEHIELLERVPITGDKNTRKNRKEAEMGELETKLVELDNQKLEKDPIHNRVIIPDDLDMLIDGKGFRNLVRVKIETEGVTAIRRLADLARKADKPNRYFMRMLGGAKWSNVTKENVDKYKLNGRRLKKLLKQAKIVLGKAEAVVWKYLAKNGSWTDLEEMAEVASRMETPATYLLKCLQNAINGKTPSFEFVEMHIKT